MSRVMVEFPIEEAEALAKRANERDGMTSDEIVTALQAVGRLKQAIAVERGPGGSAEPIPGQTTMEEAA